MRKIGIFGGTFNPPHLGHLRLARAFAQRFALDRVLIIPTFEPPHKQAQDLADAETRLLMCRMLFADSVFEVSDLEIRRGGRSYTVETLRTLRAQNPDAALYFLVGSDMLRSFDTWYRPDEIRALCTLCAAVRSPNEILPETQAQILESFEPLEISSTAVRETVRTGADPAPMVGEALASLIAQRGLYADRYTPYRKVLREKLGDYRLRHTFAVADSARALAERYGGDAEKAYFAGLMHDVMKDTPKIEMLQYMQQCGAALTEAEFHNAKLWHAMAGAAYLRTEAGVDDPDVLNAVRYHTTGRAGMSLLEKIIYVADYISADRDYNGVKKMRRLAAKSLEQAMAFGLSFTIADLARKGQVIHPDSVDCYNEICIQLRKEGETV